MGYGGSLIFSSIAYNLKNNKPDKKVIFIYPKSIKDLFKRTKSESEFIFRNNKDIDLLFSSLKWFLYKPFYSSRKYHIVNLLEEKYFHHIPSETDQKKITYKTGKHAIEHACSPLINNDIQLKPRLYLTESERRKAHNLLIKHELKDKKYICIEPNTKVSFTPNKAWPAENWSSLIPQMIEWLEKNNLSFIKIAQIGAPSSDYLPGVLQLNNEGLNFRETSEILRKSIGLIAYIGGLTHLAKASDVKNISIVSAWEPKELATYPEDYIHYHNIECMNCGLRVPCPHDLKCIKNITVNEVMESFKSLVKEQYID